MNKFPFNELTYEFQSSMSISEIMSSIESKTKPVLYGAKRFLHADKLFEGKTHSNSFKIRLFTPHTRSVYPYVHGRLISNGKETSVELKSRPWMAIKIGLCVFLFIILWISVALLASPNLKSGTHLLSYLFAVILPILMFCAMYYVWSKFFRIQSQQSFHVIEEMLK
jgi:hypothetical protein